MTYNLDCTTTARLIDLLQHAAKTATPTDDTNDGNNGKEEEEEE